MGKETKKMSEQKTGRGEEKHMIKRRMNRGRRTRRSVFVCAYVCVWGRSCKRNAVVVCTKQQSSTTTSKGPHKREQR